MSDELVQRLRDSAESAPHWLRATYTEAADEIERLRAEVELRLSELDAAWMREKTLSGRAERADSALAALRKMFAELEAAAWHGLQASAPADGESTMLTVTESCKRLIAERDALRKRVEEAPVVEWSREDWIDHCDSVSPSYIGMRVALVVLGEG